MVLNLIRTLLGLMFPLITFPYVTRVLGPIGLGKVNYAQSIVGYFSFISCFGMTTYAIREVAKVRDNKDVASKIAWELLIANLLTTCVAYLLFFFFVENSPSLYNYRHLLYICSLTMMFTTIGMDWLFVANEDFLYITLRSIAIQICSLILLFVIVKNESDYINYALLIVISSVGSNIFNLLYSRKYISLPRLSDIHVFRHFKFLYILFITSTFAGLHTVVDRSMLGYLIDDYNVGIYTTGNKISSIFISIICAVSIILFPRFSYLIKQGDDNSWKDLLDKMIHFLLLVSLPFMVALIILRIPVITLICGDAFLPSSPVLVVMSFMIPIMCFTNLLGNLLFMSMDKERWTLYSVIIGAVFNLILNYILIPLFSATGAAIAAVTSEFIVLLFQIYLLNRVISILPYMSVIAKYMLFSILMGVSMLIIRILFVPSNILNIIVIIFGGVAIYFCLLIYDKNIIVYELMHTLKKRVDNFNSNSKI